MGERMKNLTSYVQVVAAAGLDGETASRFVAFMRSRFSNSEYIQCVTGYAQEWAERFKNKAEYGYADSISQSVLMKIDS